MALGKLRQPSEPGDDRLAEAFCVLRLSHQSSLIPRTARIALGPSVLRVFAPGTKGVLTAALERVSVDRLSSVSSLNGFDAWYRHELDRVARAIRRTNTTNSRIQPGDKWGHAAKVLSIFVYQVVLNSRYFSDAQARRLQYWLYAPIDRIALGHLRRLGVRNLPAGINEIDTAAKFYRIQDALAIAARRAGVPRAWFDDLWLVRPDA